MFNEWKKKFLLLYLLKISGKSGILSLRNYHLPGIKDQMTSEWTDVQLKISLNTEN